MFKRSIILGILVVLAVAAGAGAGWGVVPTQISIQGKITKPLPLPASVNLAFQIWDSVTGGNKVGAQVPQNNVVVDTATGIFNTYIDVSAAALDFTKQYWVEIQAGTETLAPRQPLYSAPYAMTAKNVYGGTGYFGGNVGIGTTVPKSLLQVNNKVIDDNTFAYDANSTYLIHPTPTSTAALNDPKTILLLARQGTSGQAYGAGAALNLSRWENNGVNSRTRLDISLANAAFDVNSNNVMTMLSSGNVGIGNAAPQAALDITGTKGLWVRSSGADPGTLPAAAGTGIGLYYDVTSGLYNAGNYGAVQAYSWGGGAGQYLALNPRGGNVGVYTSVPQYQLDVNGDINYTGTLRHGGVAVSLGGGSTVSSQWGPISNGISYTSGRVAIGTSYATNKLTVADSDFPGIGLALPSSPNLISEFGAAAFDKYYSDLAKKYDTVLKANTGNLILTARSSNVGSVVLATMAGAVETERMRIANDGKVGIGMTSNLSSTLNVNDASPRVELYNIGSLPQGVGAILGSSVYNVGVVGLSSGTQPAGEFVNVGTGGGIGLWASTHSLGVPIYASGGGVKIDCVGNCDNAENNNANGLQIASGGASSDNYLYMGVDHAKNLSYIQSTGNSDYQPLILQKRGGNVGIGTTSPGATLHVSNDDSSGNTAVGRYGGSGDFDIDAPGIIGGRLIVKNNGDVGIGTANPLGKLQVFGGNTYLWGLNLGYGTNPAVITTDDDSKGISFQIAGSEKVSLDKSGTLAVNDNAISLRTAGDTFHRIKFDDSYAGLSDVDSVTYNANFAVVKGPSSSPSAKLVVDSNGNVGIGKTPGSSRVMLDVRNKANFDAGASFGNSGSPIKMRWWDIGTFPNNSSPQTAYGVNQFPNTTFTLGPITEMTRPDGTKDYVSGTETVAVTEYLDIGTNKILLGVTASANDVTNGGVRVNVPVIDASRQGNGNGTNVGLAFYYVPSTGHGYLRLSNPYNNSYLYYSGLKLLVIYADGNSGS
jgi:hypothetical protein